MKKVQKPKPQRKGLKKWLAKLGAFSFFRLVAFAAGMATPAGIVALLGGIIVAIILGLGALEVIDQINAPESPKTELAA